MALTEYYDKRDFDHTPEPAGEIKNSKQQLIFVIQKHHASHLHYDFRLELNGVLKSWAVPKGPSLNPDEKRLAMMVEDHPYDYRTFEGTIAEGNYGAGTVMVWDEGTYQAVGAQTLDESIDILKKGLQKGNLKFILHGHKLKGEFALVKLKGKEKNSWLLIKKKDEYATTDDIRDQDHSVQTGRSLDEINGKASLKLPDYKPMLAKLIDKPFDNKDWIYELKYDGYRAIAKTGVNPQLFSRSGISFASRFPLIVEELKKISSQVVFDGEVVALDSNGLSQFQLLQNYKVLKNNIYFYVFDILYYGGRDLTKEPLLERKRILKSLIPEGGRIRYSDYIEEKGTALFALVKEKGGEGVVAKQKSSVYQSGVRSDIWLKIKAIHEQEAIICGYTEPRGSRNCLGALILGVYEDKKLRYIGHTGGGFDTDSLERMYSRLQPYVISKSPFKKTIKTNAPVIWVKPELICQVKFAGWTKEGVMRQPIFLGMREDKKPVDVQKEISQEREKKTVRLTHQDKLYFPEDGITKGDIIEYYTKISSIILPYIVDRPQSLHRHPNGIGEKGFFQKDFTKGPSWIKTVPVYSNDEQKNINYLLCQNKETLLYMANLGCIEINPWSSCYEKQDYPDFLVLDLDPVDISFKEVVRTAQCIKDILDKTTIESFIKTSGKTGLHILIPLGAKYTFDQTKLFAQLLAHIVFKELPQVTSVIRDPKKRVNKVYIDFLQNRKGQTIAAPYSVRPVRYAPVSAPLEWKELQSTLDPIDFTIKTIFKRLEKKGDLMEAFKKHPGINMLKCLNNLQKF